MATAGIFGWGPLGKSKTQDGGTQADYARAFQLRETSGCVWQTGCEVMMREPKVDKMHEVSAEPSRRGLVELLFIAMLMAGFCHLAQGATRTYQVDSDSDAPVLFGAERLTRALQQQDRSAGGQGALQVSIKILPAKDLGKESYRISIKDGQLHIAGGDAAGAMYGALEAAERIAAGIEPVHLNGVAGSPGMAIRAVKVNLPWMSYRVHAKYNWSHGHSSPKLHVIHGGGIGDALWNPLPENYRITWMVRNEDFFLLRWCGPGFVREHIRINNKPWTGGYYVGSECYVPAANFFDKPDRPDCARWAFQRQRLFYIVWGRHLYDPKLDDATLARAIDMQYGCATGAKLIPALDLASRTPLRIATFFGATWDHTLYSEGFLTNKGFIDIRQVMKARPLDPTWLGVSAMINLEARKVAPPVEAITPLAVATAAERDAREALVRLAEIKTANIAVADEIADAATWAHLGLYLADKIRAAVALERYSRGLNDNGREESVILLQKCLKHWDEVIALTKDRFLETPLQHTGSVPFSWTRYRAAVAADILTAEKTTKQP